MNIKRIFAAVTASTVLLISGTVFNISAENSKADDIVILYTNDVHCAIDSNIGYDGLALYKKEMQEQHENVLLVDAGDSIHGAPVGELENGAYITSLMNAVGYDAAAIGNHEFYYGITELTKREQELDCGYTCSNLYDENGNCPYQPYRIVEAGEYSIAFVGVTTPDSIKNPSSPQDDGHTYSLGSDGTIFKRIQTAVDSARTEGADYVILLAHLGEKNVSKNWNAEQTVKNLSGIDAVIDGHSHEVTKGITYKSKDNKNVIVTQTGTKLVNIGKMTISEDGGITTELISNVPKPDSNSSIPESDYFKPDRRKYGYADKAVNTKIRMIDQKLDPSSAEIIGHTDFELYDSDFKTGLRRVRNGETNLGDLCADAYRYMLDTDVGIVGGAGIRSGIKAGDITANDAATVLSLGGYISSAEVTGQQILDTLELASTAYPEEKPMFLQVSGIEYTIDESVKSGVQLDENGRFLGVDGEYRIKDVIINGEPLNTDKTYTLAADSAFLNGGYLFTDNCKIIKDSVMKDSEILTAYIRDYLGGYIPEKYSEPYGEGRIKAVTAAPSVNGDINADGIFDEADIIALQDWLVCVPGAELADSEAADICSDGILNVFDLCALKRELSYQKMMYTRLKKLVRNF